MSNLLPGKNKKEIKIQFLLRFLIVITVFFLLTIILLAISLTPSYVLSQVRESVVFDKGAPLKKSTELIKRRTSADILLVEKEKVDVLKNIENINVDEIIEKIVAKSPAGLKITSFYYEKEDGDKPVSAITINGNSNNRNNLIAFVESFEVDDAFSKVDFPASNLVKGESVDFSIKIYIK